MQLQNSPAQVTQGAAVTGNTVSGYGGASGRGWDLFNQGANTTLTWDNTHSIQPGGFDIEVNVGSPAASCYVAWGNSTQMIPLVTSFWFRQVLYFTANPASTITLMAGVQSGNSAKCFDVIMTSAGKIEVRDSTSAVKVTLTNAVPLNTRFRIEGIYTPSGTSATFTVSLYSTEFAASALETEASTANALNIGAALVYWRWGQAFGASANPGAWWMGGLALSNTGPIGPGAILQQMTAGAPSQTGFTVASKVIGATSCRLKVATDAGLTQNVFYVAAQVPDSNGYVSHAVTGLAAHTQYYVQVTDTPASTATETLFGAAGACKTLPATGGPANFTVSFASCIATTDTNSPAASTAMADWVNWNADIKIFTGDFDYFDATYTDEYSQIGVFESQVHQGADGGAGAIQQMLAQGWGFYCASDHDTGPDNGDSNTAWMPASIAARQEVFPQGALGDTTFSPVHGLYQSWVAGRVRFILIDIRNTDRSPGANTDNSSKTMLGATQLAWFQNQLIQPEPLKVVIGDTQWMGNVVAGQNDKWWAYDTERQAIIAYIAAHKSQVQNMMWWHGDFHGLGCTPGASNPWGGFPVYCAAPICQTGAAVQDTSTFTQMYNNSGGECRQYGRVTFTDTGSQISVLFAGWDAAASTARISQTDTFSIPVQPWTLTAGTAPLAMLTAADAAGVAAVTVLLGLLDEGGGQVLDEAGNPILDESGG